MIDDVDLVEGAHPDATPRRPRCVLQTLIDLGSSELKYVWQQSVLLMFDVLQHMPCTNRVASLPSEERLRHPCLRWNPVWWGGIFGCAACMLPGHSFHILCGQGGPVRPDELTAERKARIFWVYTYSGGFVFTALMDLVTLLVALCNETGEALRQTVVSCSIAIFLSLWYLAGDLNLLFQMGHKNTIMMHAAAISRISYGVAFLLCFAIGLLSSAGRAVIMAAMHKNNTPSNSGSNDSLPQETAISWFLRLCFSIFMVIAVVGYKPLLELQYDEDEGMTQQGTYKMKVICVSGSMFAGAIGVLFVFEHALTKQAIGRTKAWPRFLAACIVLPSVLLVVACLMERARPTLKQFLAALLAMLPFIVVGSAFVICGPHLWSMLAGA